MNTPKTLIEAVTYYADEQICRDVMVQVKWPNGKITCPECGCDRCKPMASRPKYIRCADCKKQFSYKVGTIFEDSPLSLSVWFVAVWCIANAKNGISSCELARATGVTQKTAWFMLHRIRTAMKTGTFQKLGGTFETDETYIGGKAANMHEHKRAKAIQGRGSVGNAIVHGIIKRGDSKQHSRVIANAVGHDDAPTVLGRVRRHVRYGANVFSDAAGAYAELCLTHLHRAIDHSRTHVRGHVHTNGIENFWCLLKRTIGGTYTAVAPLHLNRYVAEQVFRFNERKTTDADQFAQVMLQVVGKRLTYRVLTATDDAGFMGII